MSATMHSARRDTTRGDGAQTPLAKLWHGPATLGGSGRTAGGLPLVVHAHHLRPLRQGARWSTRRGAPEAERYADPGHHRPHATRPDAAARLVRMVEEWEAHHAKP